MSAWNFDMSEAPRGHHEDRAVAKGTRKVFIPARIIAAASDGTVTLSNWIPDQQRWNMFTEDAPPIAWMPWPEHPGSQPCPPAKPSSTSPLSP